MIKSFKHKGLETFFYIGSQENIERENISRLERVLDRLHAAHRPNDMWYPGSNLQAIPGDERERYAVEVSEERRIFFAFAKGHAFDVDYVDLPPRRKGMTEMKRRPIHPGKIIREDYLKPLGLTITHLAETIGVSRKTLSKIVNGKGSVSPDMALRLSRAFGTSPEFWLNLQKHYDLWQAEHGSNAWRSVKPISYRLLHSDYEP